MGTPLTIEGFFLADYTKVKERNEELEREIYEVKAKYAEQSPESGFEDLRTPVKLVKVTTECSSYYMFERSEAPFKDCTIKDIQALIDMPDEELLEKVKKTKISYSTHMIEVKSHTFPFTVRFKTYKGTKIYAYDPDRSAKELVDFYDHAVVDGDWVVSDFKNECIRLALETVRESCRERIAEMQQEAEPGDE